MTAQLAAVLVGFPVAAAVAVAFSVWWDERDE